LKGIIEGEFTGTRWVVFEDSLPTVTTCNQAQRARDGAARLAHG
jgi:hypothetical protein